MLRIVDKNSKTKFVLRDTDEEPITIDELLKREIKKEEEEQDAKSDAVSNH